MALTNQPLPAQNRTFDETTGQWKDSNRTWAFPGISVTNQSRNSATPTNQSKSVPKWDDPGTAWDDGTKYDPTQSNITNQAKNNG